MRIGKAFLMSIGMFSTFPMPKNTWDDECIALVIPLFPLVGAMIGCAWVGSAWFLRWTGMPVVLVTALAGLAPFFFSGCLHLDGWMDTVDAVFSRRDLDERRMILKDPHVGAFGVLSVACLFVVHFSALYTVLDANKAFIGLFFLCVLSRAATGIALLNNPPISGAGYMATFQKGKRPAHTIWLVGVVMATLAITIFIHWKVTLACTVALLTAFLTEKYLLRQMQGLSGDLCGCILTLIEVCGLLCLAVL